MTYSDDDLTAAAVEVLRQAGPLTVDELVDVLLQAGFQYRGRIVDVLMYADDPLFGTLEDGRHVALDTFLEGRVLTHRVSQQEIDADMIESATDLSPLSILAGHYGEADGGIALTFRGFDSELFEERGVQDTLWPPDEVLVVDRGTLKGFRAGDVIALVAQSGALEVRPVSSALDAPEFMDPLNAILADGQTHFLDVAVWQLMDLDPSLFATPSTPLGELIAAAGVERQTEQVAQAGFDFGDHALRQRVASVGIQYGLDTDEAGAVIAFIELVNDAADEGHAHALVSAAAAELDPLRRDHVAHAVCRHALDPEALDTAASAMLAVLPRRMHAAAHWFQGVVALRSGRVLDAEPAFDQALTVDPSFTDALIGAARFALFRGDATRGMSLVNRIESTPRTEGIVDELMYHFGALVPQPHPELGRNDKCWCGSGRKYKVCHLGRADVPVRARIAAIGPKAAAIAEMTANVSTMYALESIRADQMAHLDGDHPDAGEDPFVQDVTLVEGGLVAAYVEAVGSIMQPEDVLVAQQYQMAERSVYEIVSVEPGVGMSLRDIRTGDQVDVTERRGSRGVKVGEFYCLRVVPVGEHMQLFGGIEPVGAAQRSELIGILDEDPTDPEALVEFLGRRFAPPRMVTREGDPVLWCEATVELAAADTIRRKLSRRYGAADGNRWTWTEGESLLGSLELEGTKVRVEAMSESRFEELVESVLSLDPEAVVSSEKRTSTMETSFADHVEVDDPEIIALLDQRVREYEKTWVDESIPALEGLTPREAAADPTRRDDLVRLLDSFPQDEQPGAMSMRRLKVALGLD